MELWKDQMLEKAQESQKRKVLNFFIFLALWGIVYYLIKFNFGLIALILSYMFVYFRTDKSLVDGIIFISSEYDRHHNELANELNNFNQDRDELMQEISELRMRIEELEQK